LRLEQPTKRGNVGVLGETSHLPAQFNAHVGEIGLGGHIRPDAREAGEQLVF
jgi:hypothetical protein